jgi:hypothetical protein
MSRRYLHSTGQWLRTYPPWAQEFRRFIAGTPAETAARSLMGCALDSELHSVVTAIAAIPRWEQGWLEDDASRQALTARSYASRLRVALREWGEL